LRLFTGGCSSPEDGLATGIIAEREWVPGDQAGVRWRSERRAGPLWVNNLIVEAVGGRWTVARGPKDSEREWIDLGDGGAAG